MMLIAAMILIIVKIASEKEIKMYNYPSCTDPEANLFYHLGKGPILIRISTLLKIFKTNNMQTILFMLGHKLKCDVIISRNCPKGKFYLSTEKETKE